MRAEPEKAGPEFENLEKKLSADGEFWTYVEISNPPAPNTEHLTPKARLL